MAEESGIKFFTERKDGMLVVVARGVDVFIDHPGFGKQCFLLDTLSASGGYTVDRDPREFFEDKIFDPTETVYVWAFRTVAFAIVAHALYSWSLQHRAGFPLWINCQPFELKTV